MARPRKIPPEKIPEILRLLDAGAEWKAVAKRYGVTRWTLQRLVGDKVRRRRRPRRPLSPPRAPQHATLIGV